MIITYAWPDDHSQKPNSFVARGKPGVFRPATFSGSLCTLALRLSFYASANDQPVRSLVEKKVLLGHLLLKQNRIDLLSDFDHLV